MCEVQKPSSIEELSLPCRSLPHPALAWKYFVVYLKRLSSSRLSIFTLTPFWHSQLRPWREVFPFSASSPTILRVSGTAAAANTIKVFDDVTAGGRDAEGKALQKFFPCHHIIEHGSQLA